MPARIKININPYENPRVLVAPLDWGLGHATRCIPIIKELLNQRCTVIIACAGAHETLLREEFPSLTFIELPGYEIKYDKNRAFTILRLMRAIPKILIRIKRERAWLGQLAGRGELDLVISDNRYGLVSADVPSIIITHQLLIKTPFGGWMDRMLQSLNYRLIRHFWRCWVPDNTLEGLAGELSHPSRMPPVPTHYIGWLSRFGGTGGAVGESDTATDPFLLALLSGPEPQRTLLEKEIIRQALVLKETPACRLVIVRGLPRGGEFPPALPQWVEFYDHLPASALEPLLRAARLVVARAGYSTIMDLERLGKRSILIPTPGQSEQEYLGPYLAGKGWTICVDQRDFSLSNAFTRAMAGGGARERLPEDAGLLASEINAVLGELKKPVDPAY